LRERKEQLLRALVENLPLSVWAVDRGGIVTIHEGKDPAAAGVAPGQTLGMSILELYPDIGSRIEKALAGERSYWSAEAHGAHLEKWAVPLQDEQGEVAAVAGITLDISKSKRIEQYLRAQLEIVKWQQQVIRDLSTPIIEVWDG